MLQCAQNLQRGQRPRWRWEVEGGSLLQSLYLLKILQVSLQRATHRHPTTPPHKWSQVPQGVWVRVLPFLDRRGLGGGPVIWAEEYTEGPFPD